MCALKKENSKQTEVSVILSIPVFLSASLGQILLKSQMACEIFRASYPISGQLAINLQADHVYVCVFYRYP